MLVSLVRVVVVLVLERAIIIGGEVVAATTRFVLTGTLALWFFDFSIKESQRERTERTAKGPPGAACATSGHKGPS